MVLPTKKTVMKSMKSAKPSSMKAMKVMKTKRVSKIARGKHAKLAVFRGKKEKTASGKTKEDLMINKRGKVVHKKASARGQERYKKYLMGWNQALMKARNELGIKGMCCVGGKTAQGKALYLKAKAIYTA